MAIGTPTSLGTPVVSALGGPYTFTTSVTAPSSSLIIVLASFGRSVDPGAGTLSGGSLTWQTDQGNVFNGGYFYRFGIYSGAASSGLASSTVLTLTATGATDGVQFAAYYCTGLDLTASRKDVSNGAGAAATAWSSGSATSTNANDLVIGGSFVDGTATSTPGGGFTELADFQNAGNAWSETVVYKIVAATGSQSASGTWTSAANHVSSFAAYKDSGGGGGGTTVKQLAELGVG
jgi:hypothetical protein